MTHSDCINNYLSKTIEAINCLKTNGFVEAALVLTYVSIDKMSWLAIMDKESNVKDFKKWVDTYINPSDNLGCSTDDLWAARNGLIHTGAAESRDFYNKKGVKKIFYTVDHAICTENRSEDTLILNITNLIISFINGSARFIADLEKDASKLAVAGQKAGTMLSFRIID